jgi:hypothetical protein
MNKEKLVEKEEKVLVFDPIVNAYREIPISIAKKWVESSKEVEQKIKELEQ